LRFVAQYRAREQYGLLLGVIQTARRVTLIASIVLALGGIAIVALGGINSEWKLPLILAFASVPFVSLLILNIDIATGFGWTIFAYAPDQLLRQITVIAGVGAYMMINGAADAKDAITVTLLAYAGVLVYQIYGLRKRAEFLQHAEPKMDVRLWFATSLPLWLGALSDTLLERIDVLLIGHLMPPENVAIFSVASRTAGLTILIQYAVIAPATSIMGKLHARGRIDELAAFVKDMQFLTIWPSIVFALFLALAGPTLLRIFGPEFSGGELPFYTLLAGQLLGICTGPGFTLLILTGHQTATMLTIASTTMISTLLNWYLISKAGIEGAAIATALSIVFRGVVLAVLTRRYLGVSTISFSPKRRLSVEQGPASAGPSTNVS
jgi:O-antigen/teichoic acid export membrane protein